MSIEKKESNEKQRLYYLDWLRIFAIFMVFVYHTARIFSQRNEIVNDPEYVQEAYFFEWMILPFGMPLFFIISGMSVFYGIQYMKKKGIPKINFLKERTIRLFIPYIIGALTYISIMVCLIRVNDGTYTAKYDIYDPRNFIDFYIYAYFDIQNALFIGSGLHLWFLLLLFIFNLILYRYFTSKVYEKNQNTENQEIKKEKDEKKKETMKPKSMFLLIIPLYLIEVIHPFAILGLPRAGGWENLNFFLFFYLGFKYCSQGDFQEKLKNNIKTAYVIGFITLILRLIELFLYTAKLIRYEEYNFYYFLYWALFVLNGWSIMIIILYCFSKFLNKDHKYRKKLNEIVMPFYIIHLIILNLVAAYAFLFFNSNPMIAIGRIIIIGGLSFILIFGLSLLVAKIKILRPIFGMRKK
ncbi:MAG: acyltransferase [archaeon]|nr:acyltransferase [archaeon]